MLLTEPIQKDGAQLPSPEQLKRKIILKVRNCPKICFEFSLGNPYMDSDKSLDLLSFILYIGLQYLSDPY